MKKHLQGRTGRILSVILFSVGLLLGLAFSAAAVWADLEASLFDSALGADESLKTLNCPVIITPKESGVVSARFGNPSDRAVLRTVRAHISYGFATLIREASTQFVLEPGESRKLEWEVGSDDAAWERLVLVRINVLRNHPLPSVTGSCGILVMNLPVLTGGQFVALILTLSLLGIAAGAALWASERSSWTARMQALTIPLAVLTALVLAAMLTGALGWWALGLLLILFTLILAASVAAWTVLKAS